VRAQAIIAAVRVLRWIPDRPNTFTTEELARGLDLHMRTAYRIANALCVAGVTEVAEEFRSPREPRLYRASADR
jgi:DNA-binding IclR family transcriptional regulator